MTGNISRGILSSDDLMMRSPLLRVAGKGRINLVEETIDYLVKPVLVNTLEGQGRQDLDDLAGVPVPIKLSGNLYEPDFNIDIVAALSGLQKAKFDEKKDQLKDKVLGSLLGGKADRDTEGAEPQTDPEKDGSKEYGDSAKGLLKGLLGGKWGKDKEKDDDDDA